MAVTLQRAIKPTWANLHWRKKAEGLILYPAALLKVARDAFLRRKALQAGTYKVTTSGFRTLESCHKHYLPCMLVQFACL